MNNNESLNSPLNKLIYLENCLNIIRKEFIVVDNILNDCKWAIEGVLSKDCHCEESIDERADKEALKRLLKEIEDFLDED